MRWPERTRKERFEGLFEPEPCSGCFLWFGRIDEDGYGRFRWGATQMMKAHRAAYLLYVGPIPDGLTLDHLCRVRSCVNPRHVEPVTNRENALRGLGQGAHNAKKIMCVHGHEFSPENTYRRPSRPRRDCRICIERRALERAARRERRMA